jgi:hypothetical protein
MAAARCFRMRDPSNCDEFRPASRRTAMIDIRKPVELRCRTRRTAIREFARSACATGITFKNGDPLLKGCRKTIDREKERNKESTLRGLLLYLFSISFIQERER